MKVKNKRAIALAFLALVLAGFSLFVYIAQGRVRFLFFSHPGVSVVFDAAVSGVPHQKLGGRSCLLRR